MRIFATIFFLFAFLLCNIQAQDQPAFKYYKDKIARIEFSENSKNDGDIFSAKNNNANGIILYNNVLSSSFSQNNFQNALKTITIASAEVKHNNLFSYIQLDFEKLNSIKNNPAVRTNFSKLVSTVELDGFYLTDVDFSKPENLEFLENLCVEAALIKPFLAFAISKKSFSSNVELANKYINQGIIDFVFDEDSEFSIPTISSINKAETFILQNYLKRIKPESFYSLDFSKLINSNVNEVTLKQDNRSVKLSTDKKFNFISFVKTDTLKFSANGKSFFIPKNDWVIPYNYLLNQDNSVSRTGNWIEFRRPFEKNTNINTYSLLCRTKYPAKVFINNEEVKIYNTGVFFSKIKLNEGLNKLRAEAKYENGTSVIYEDRVYYSPKQIQQSITQLSIDDSGILPNENILLTENDYLTISFNGTKGQLGSVVIEDEKNYDCTRKDFSSSSKYEVQIPLKSFKSGKAHSIKLLLKPSEPNSTLTQVTKLLKNNFTIKDESDFPLLETTDNNSLFAYTLAPIRLGAPLRNELHKGVLLKSNGIFGDYYRIKLSSDEEGYISKEFVKELPAGTTAPIYFINPLSAFPTDTCDVVRIPYLENVPYDVYPEPNQNRITITLFGVRTSSTWIIHKSNLRFVEELTWQQTSKDVYKIFVNLKSSKIWGYELKPNGKELLLRLKYPPVYNLKSKTPLKGIKISIEAGHGGTNTGAVGLSGLKEKEINLDLSKKLEAIFKKFGAEVFQVRDSDEDMTLLDKRNLAINSNANIHFSIHANSSEPITEFLGTSGTCTFYHNPFWAKFAENVYDKLVELDLKPFGSVGSFNYRVTRMSEMPSILVEQAFMSHAEDEEKLADNSFRVKMANKIYDGLINYLKFMKE